MTSWKEVLVIIYRKLGKVEGNMPRRVNLITAGIAALAIIGCTMGANYLMTYAENKQEAENQTVEVKQNKVQEIESVNTDNSQVEYNIQFDTETNKESPQDIGYKRAVQIAADDCKKVFDKNISNAFIKAHINYDNEHGLVNGKKVFVRTYFMEVTFEDNKYEAYEVVVNAISGEVIRSEKKIEFGTDSYKQEGTDKVLANLYNYSLGEEGYDGYWQLSHEELISKLHEYEDTLKQEGYSDDEIWNMKNDYINELYTQQCKQSGYDEQAKQYIQKYNLISQEKLGDLVDITHQRHGSVVTLDACYKFNNGGEIQIIICEKTKEMLGY